MLLLCVNVNINLISHHCLHLCESEQRWSSGYQNVTQWRSYNDYCFAHCDQQNSILIRDSDIFQILPTFDIFHILPTFDCQFSVEVEIEFHVRAAAEARVLLAPCDGCDGYEVVIGGWNNSQSVIRHAKLAPTCHAVTQVSNRDGNEHSQSFHSANQTGRQL